MCLSSLPRMRFSTTDLFYLLGNRNKIIEVRPSGKIASGTSEVSSK